jgi:hypothetical protein
MGSIENTAAEGQTAALLHRGQERVALQRCAEPRPAHAVGGVHLLLDRLSGRGNEGNRIKRYRWEIIASDIVEIEMAFDTKLVAPELGYFFTTAIASATTRSLSALAGFSSRAGTS